MDCMVRNMSLSGARLEVSQNFILPTEFELEIPQRGSVLLCALIWRKDDAVGVKFLDSKGPIRRAPTAASQERQGLSVAPPLALHR
jgi:hypothetical protein